MAELMIQLHAESLTAPCSLCGQPVLFPAGPVLCLKPDGLPVCRECGKRHSPALLALLDLADVAQRVGRVARHTLVPSFETLLDLARAAENYTFASESRRQAA
ncbi:MAG TPA: hypothetical protein VNK04_19450 [Gemmataceae bacterium]|jgi:NAD-dependent SIR2 family protein deacetylase|nr:hypothetical protein [Gemmataceae bacterium]